MNTCTHVRTYTFIHIVHVHIFVYRYALRVLHCVYTYTLQHSATHCITLQHTASHCNTLQHTATHRNIPPHTASHTRHNTIRIYVQRFTCTGKYV